MSSFPPVYMMPMPASLTMPQMMTMQQPPQVLTMQQQQPYGVPLSNPQWTWNQSNGGKGKGKGTAMGKGNSKGKGKGKGKGASEGWFQLKSSAVGKGKGQGIEERITPNQGKIEEGVLCIERMNKRTMQEGSQSEGKKVKFTVTFRDTLGTLSDRFSASAEDEEDDENGDEPDPDAEAEAESEDAKPLVC